MLPSSYSLVKSKDRVWGKSRHRKPIVYSNHWLDNNYRSEQKTSTVYKAMLGRYESKLENSKNGFGAILSRVEFQIGPYKTSYSKHLKNITVGLYPTQNFVVDTFTRCQAKLSESRFRIFDSYHLISPLHSQFSPKIRCHGNGGRQGRNLSDTIG